MSSYPEKKNIGLVLNKLTKAQFDANRDIISTELSNELFFTIDENDSQNSTGRMSAAAPSQESQYDEVVLDFTMDDNTTVSYTFIARKT